MYKEYLYSGYKRCIQCSICCSTEYLKLNINWTEKSAAELTVTYMVDAIANDFIP